MARLYAVSCLLPLLLSGLVGGQDTKVNCYPGVSPKFHDYGAMTINSHQYVRFNKYNGKYVLVVNVASFCNLTSQYVELNKLTEELDSSNVVILGFPSNQFGKSEPGENAEILNTIKHVRPGGEFVPNFQLFEKGDVNGENEQKVFTFLKNACPPTSELLGQPDGLFWKPMKVHDIRWNFEKFLVGPDGVPIMRWHHLTQVSTVKNDILAYLRQKSADASK